MNDNVRAWIARLESDEMQGMQTTKKLGTPEGKRCCLGVACDLAVEAGVIPAPRTVYDFEGPRLRYASRDCDLPPAVAAWLGLATANGGYGEDRCAGMTSCLSEDNDNGQTFRQIAATIKAAPPGLFG